MVSTALAGGGPACAVETVERNTGVRIEHFAVVDFDGFVDVVDALGGVTVCLPEAVDDPKSHLDLPRGRSRVAGDQALAYVRARHGVPGSDGSDTDRIGRQQQFLSSVVQQITSTEVLLRPDRLVSFLDAATRSLTTDPELADLRRLTVLAQGVSGLRPDDVQLLTVPVEAYEPDPNRLRWAAGADDLWEALRTDSPLPGAGADEEQTPPPAAALTVSPAGITVEVRHATGLAGRAGEAGEDLARQGFTVPAVGNADLDGLDGARVSHPPGAREAARTVAAAFPGAALVEDARLDDVLVVTLGDGAPDVAEVPDRLGDEPLPSRGATPPTADLDPRSAGGDICH